MYMGKFSAVLDISSSSVKLLIGTVIGDSPVVIYKKCLPCHAVMQDGTIQDHDSLKKVINELRHINDADLKMKTEVNAVSLILPSNSLKVFPHEHSLVANNQNNVISSYDIRNILYAISKEKTAEGYEIADIIAETFKTSDGQIHQKAPIGQYSESLTLRCRIYALPTGIAEDYQKTLESLGMRVNHRTVSSHAYACLFRQDKNLPESYLLIDMGGDETSVSLIGRGAPYVCHSFSLGGYGLTRTIADRFSIPFDDAERIKITYGYDDNLISYKPALIKVDNGNGTYTKVSQNDLNEAILSDMGNYIKYLDAAMNEICAKNFKGSFTSLPLLFTGGASQLYGLERILKGKYPENAIYLGSGNAIGAREATFACCLGDLIAEKESKLTNDESNESVASLSRDDGKNTSKRKEKKAKRLKVEDEDVI